MGYTHYINRPEWTTADELGYAKALPIVKKILKRHAAIIQRDDDDPKRPIADARMIWFNGIGEEGHETFVFENKRQGANDMSAYCKTNQKAYDLPVCEVLLVLKAFCPHLAIGSDGFTSNLAKPELDDCWPQAIENVKQYGIHYRAEITNRRDPYCDMMPAIEKIESVRAPLTNKQYARWKGNACPFCGSSDLEGEAVDIEDGKAYQSVMCHCCKKAWRDEYKLVGYTPE
jgi:hypothetical protein